MATFVSSNQIDNDEKRIVELMKMGMSRVEAERYVREHPLKLKDKQKTPITILPPTPKPPKPRIELAGWEVFTAIDNVSYTLEGLVIAPSAKYFHKGWFFISIDSALKFLKKYTAYSESIYITISKLRKKPGLKCGGGKADFIAKQGNTTPVIKRSVFCEFIKKALSTYDKSIQTDQTFLSERFKYEPTLNKFQCAKFLEELKHHQKALPPAPKPPAPIVKLPNGEFEDNGVKMRGTTVKAELVSFPKDKAMEEYFVPSYVDTIKSNAFNGTNKLQSIRIGKGVKFIESNAFIDNSSLVSITIPSTVLKVDAGAFTRCSALRAAFIRTKSSDISPKLFDDCKSLEFIATPNEQLRGSMQIIREFSRSNVVLKVHKSGEKANYPHLDHNEKIVVMGNIYNCLKRNHPIKSMWVNVQIRENGVIKDVPICVFRCKRCKKTFILPDIYYYYLMRYDFVNTKLFIRLDYDTWYTGSKMKCLNDPFDSNGVLKSAGYNVNEVEGLSHSTRVRILRDVIEFGILSKAEVEQRLQHFIDYNGASARNELARSKWQEDLRAIHQIL